MKTCPHCKASLEDEARFCLYCMTSLDKKEVIVPAARRRKTPLWGVAVLLVAVLIGLLVWQPWSGDHTASSFDSQTGDPVYTDNTVQYTYRTAERYRDYSAAADVAEDALAITGVTKPSENGVYVIPDAIDGHPVYKIDGLAFSDEAIRDTVKTVVFSSSIRRVDDYAFAACNNLTDVYYCGKGIFVDAFAYPEPDELNDTLTIHCAADCHDYRFRYHKDQTIYDYEEWNGGDLW